MPYLCDALTSNICPACGIKACSCFINKVKVCPECALVILDSETQWMKRRMAIFHLAHDEHIRRIHEL
jgi:hypothetical protein